VVCQNCKRISQLFLHRYTVALKRKIAALEPSIPRQIYQRPATAQSAARSGGGRASGGSAPVA